MERKSEHNNTAGYDVQYIKAKLESAKEELKRRYGEAVEKIKEDLHEEDDNAKDAWENLKSRF